MRDDVNSFLSFQKPIGKAEAETLLRCLSKRFYTYGLHRPDGSLFYVGKGQGKRVFEHESEARNTSRIDHRLNVIRKVYSCGGSLLYTIDRCFDVENDVHERERNCIQHFGRVSDAERQGVLTNLCAGGEGVSDPSPEVTARHAATLSGIDGDSEQARLNGLFREIAVVASTPIKATSRFKLEPIGTAHPQTRSATDRCVAAIAASAIATVTVLEVGALIPRVFVWDGILSAVERGVARDALKAGVVTLANSSIEKNEVFVLTSLGLDRIVQVVGRAKLIEAGILCSCGPS